MTSYNMNKKQIKPSTTDDYIHIENSCSVKCTYKVVFSRNVKIETETLNSPSSKDDLVEWKQNIYTVRDPSKPAIIVARYYNNQIVQPEDTIIDLYHIVEYIPNKGWVFPDVETS